MGILPRDYGGNIEWLPVLVFALFIGVILLLVIAALPGLGMPRDTSEYTGHVVDVQYESGYIIENTVIHMKTHPEASESESFCVAVPENEAFVEEARSALREGDRVTVTYERGLFENPWDCKSDKSLVTDIDRHTGGEQPDE